MAHTSRDKDKLLKRVARIRGQVDAIETALRDGHECSSALQLIASCRGAINGLMAEVVEGHVRYHVLAKGVKPDSEQARAAEELIDLVKTYLK